MRLIYRGVSYEYNHSSLEGRESDVFARNRDAQQRCRTLQENSYPLIYRGVQYTTDQVANSFLAPASRSVQTMIYRGVKYTKNPDGTVQYATSTGKYVIPSATAVAKKGISTVHRDNLRRNLERRLQAAKERGDQSLVSLLEAESRELAL